MSELEQNPYLWQKEEGQLAVDVIETREKIIIRSAIAGIKPEDLDINVTGDIVTIRGTRESAKEYHDATIHFEEYFWGTFSRSISAISEETLTKF